MTELQRIANIQKSAETMQAEVLSVESAVNTREDDILRDVYCRLSEITELLGQFY